MATCWLIKRHPRYVGRPLWSVGYSYWKRSFWQRFSQSRCFWCSWDFDSCTTNPFGVLCEPLDYDEVTFVCSKLKLGVTGLCIDYEHIRFAGPPVWRLLFEMYQNFYANGSVCESLKTGVILPLFKRKGAKANNKDNYRGITLFPTLCKIYEMVFINRLENYAKQNRLFTNLQFRFQEGVGV